MKKIMFVVGLASWLNAVAFGAGTATNIVIDITTSLLAAKGSEAVAIHAVMLQLRDIDNLKTEALAGIPGMRVLNAQIADLTARLRVAEETRRALIASNRTVVANLDHEASQVRAALKRSENPVIAARLQQRLAEVQRLVATNIVAATGVASGEQK